MFNEKFKTIFKIQAGAIMMLGIAMLIPLCIAIYNKEGNCTSAFGIVALASAIFGFIGYRFIPSSSYRLKSRDGFIVMAITWFFAAIIGSLPYILSGEIPGIIDAIFETFSGFTTTGASVAKDVESLSMSILMWRSITQWIGGLGLLLLLGTFFHIEGQTPHKGLLIVYSGFTVAETIALLCCKLSLFDAVCISFATVSTGGFTNYQDGMMHFLDKPLVLMIVTFFMFISALNILSLYSVKRRDVKKVFTSEETKFFILLVIFLGVFAAGINYINGYDGFFRSFFQVVSIASTTGFCTSYYSLWPAVSKLVLIFLFIMGACTYSAGGGLKAKNVLVSAKLIHRSFNLKIHPNRMAPVTLNGKDMTNDEVIEVTNFTFAYIGIILLGTFLLSFSNLDFTSTFTTCLSMLGNVGPGFGLVSNIYSFIGLNGVTKLVCCFLMLLGRLEIFPVLALFSRHYWNSNKL